MTNRYGVTLVPAAVRWAAAEGMSETIITAVLLLHEQSASGIASKLDASELEHVIRLVGRCPSWLSARNARCPQERDAHAVAAARSRTLRPTRRPIVGS